MNDSKSSESSVEGFFGGVIALGAGGYFVWTQILIPLGHLIVALINQTGVLLTKLFHFLISIFPVLHGIGTLVLALVVKAQSEEQEHTRASFIEFNRRLKETDDCHEHYTDQAERTNTEFQLKLGRLWKERNALKADLDRVLSIPDIRTALDLMKAEEAVKAAVEPARLEGAG